LGFDALDRVESGAVQPNVLPERRPSTPTLTELIVMREKHGTAVIGVD